MVGAGLSGLMAARRLVDTGHDVTVLDKGRSPGGRLATRRIEADGGATARLDHGAQFFTVRSDTMQRFVDDWMRIGLVRVWCRGFSHGSLDVAPGSAVATRRADDGFPRHVVVGGMTALAKHLAEGLDVRCGEQVRTVRRVDATRWSVEAEGSLEADAVVVTCPLPQSCALLDGTGVDVPDALRATEYDRTIALLAVLDAPSAVPAPGGVQRADPVFSWIGDNVAKGVSDVPALTFHASPDWSEQHWDTGEAEQSRLLHEAAAPWFGDAHVVASQVKRWRYATPRTLWPEPYWSDGATRLVLAGDAFAGPRVEGAVLSGVAAAEALVG